MSATSVRPGLRPLFSPALPHSPQGGARSPRRNHPSASGPLITATADAAPCCPWPRRPQPASTPAIPTWEELLGRR